MYFRHRNMELSNTSRHAAGGLILLPVMGSQTGLNVRCGCVQTGVLYACGKNQQGQLGVNSFEDQHQLQPVHNLG